MKRKPSPDILGEYGRSVPGPSGWLGIELDSINDDALRSQHHLDDLKHVVRHRKNAETRFFDGAHPNDLLRGEPVERAAPDEPVLGSPMRCRAEQAFETPKERRAPRLELRD